MVAAAFVSLFLCCGFFFWATREATQDAALVPQDEGGGISPVVNDDLPLKIYDWEEKHFTLAFNRFMSDHGKSYPSLEEKQRRYRIFKANMTHIRLHNEQGKKQDIFMIPPCRSNNRRSEHRRIDTLFQGAVLHAAA